MSQNTRPAPNRAADERAKRLAQALRDNLRRRKAQNGGPDQTGGPEATRADGSRAGTKD